MKKIIPIFFICSCVLAFTCHDRHHKSKVELPVAHLSEKTTEVLEGKTIADRFEAPAGYVRNDVESNSFAYYLRHFPLYPENREVRYFNGGAKLNQGHHVAVLDIDVGTKDLQQCADAIMRLRAEYLYAQKKYDDIAFHFVSGFNAIYSKWRNGMRIKVVGNKVNWYQTNKPSEDHASFKSYLEMVFMYAGTPSLEKELKPKSISDINIGDVFIQGGRPGHAVLVVDVATHRSTGDKVFLLAQSYMPAQDIHVLKNPENDEFSPWFSVEKIANKLYTPEWTFNRNDLRGF